MITYHYEIGPVNKRAISNPKIFTGTVQARNYGTAVQMASERADEITGSDCIKYGVIRLGE